MYDNIGAKIKGVAKFLGIGGTILLVLAAVISFWVSYEAMSAEATILGIAFLFCIPLCIIGSFPLYGFGELVEKAGEIAEMNMAKRATNPISPKRAESPRPQTVEEMAEYDENGELRPWTVEEMDEKLAQTE